MPENALTMKWRYFNDYPVFGFTLSRSGTHHRSL
jgi:hypothetical protein